MRDLQAYLRRRIDCAHPHGVWSSDASLRRSPCSSARVFPHRGPPVHPASRGARPRPQVAVRAENPWGAWWGWRNGGLSARALRARSTAHLLQPRPRYPPDSILRAALRRGAGLAAQEMRRGGSRREPALSPPAVAARSPPSSCPSQRPTAGKTHSCPVTSGIPVHQLVPKGRLYPAHVVTEQRRACGAKGIKCLREGQGEALLLGLP